MYRHVSSIFQFPWHIRVITKLPNSEQSYKGKVKTHKYINRQNQSTTENCENRNDPDLVQAFLKKWWHLISTVRIRTSVFCHVDRCNSHYTTEDVFRCMSS